MFCVDTLGIDKQRLIGVPTSHQHHHTAAFSGSFFVPVLLCLTKKTNLPTNLLIKSCCHMILLPCLTLVLNSTPSSANQLEAFRVPQLVQLPPKLTITLHNKIHAFHEGTKPQFGLSTLAKINSRQNISLEQSQRETIAAMQLISTTQYPNKINGVGLISMTL